METPVTADVPSPQLGLHCEFVLSFLTHCSALSQKGLLLKTPTNLVLNLDFLHCLKERGHFSLCSVASLRRGEPRTTGGSAFRFQDAASAGPTGGPSLAPHC
jgi:hypothetical protein